MKALLAVMLAGLALPALAGVEVHPVGPSRDRRTLHEAGKYHIDPVTIISVKGLRGQASVPDKVSYDSVFVGHRTTTDGLSCFAEEHARSSLATTLATGDRYYPVSVSSRKIVCPENQ